jgi:hypothetical protein
VGEDELPRRRQRVTGSAGRVRVTRMQSPRGRHGGVVVAATVLVLASCKGADAPKSWSSLAVCLAGPAASAPVLERVGKLRAAELATNGAKGKDSWPERCAVHAEALYAASSDLAGLHRKLHDKLGCADEPGHCVIAADDSLISTSTELWESAQNAGLKVDPVAGVPAPALAVPVLDAKTWKSVSEQPARVVGPHLASDGSAVLLLAPKEGRGKPRACKLPAGFARASCIEPNAKVAELPWQSIELVPDARGIYAAGLAEDANGKTGVEAGPGLAAFNLETGERSDVRGASHHLVSDGVAVEADTEVPAGARQAVVGGASPVALTVSEKGFVAVELHAGKASKATKLAAQPVGAPITLGDQIVYLTGEAGQRKLEAKALSKGRLRDVASVQGAFDGAFHVCDTGPQSVIATFAGHAGQHGAAPSLGKDKTQFAITFRNADGWSKAQEATLPFDRVLDSDLVCSKGSASVAWVRPAASGVEVGRLDCSADACKPNTVSLPALESKWWWGIAPLGDKVLLVWRSSFGDTRFRLAPLAQLPTAPDQILFDSPDFGGPNAGEVTQLASATALLLIFNEAHPVLLSISADAQARLLAH